MQETLIKIDHLDFYYDYKKPTQMLALKDVNLEVYKGEYVVFFGPSGCGKTTLTSLVGGIITGGGGTGSIIVNESDILKLSRDGLTRFRQTGIGIIFQNFNLIPSLTVLDNVALPMTFIGVPQKERRETAYGILERLSMEKYAERYPTELSGGQQQRAGIARALANNPPIIIADEPLGNLDSENAELVLKFLKELQEKDKRTIIMVTHEAWSVRDADRIIYMRDGAILRTTQGSKKEIEIQAAAVPVSPPLFQKLYPNLTQGEVMVKSLSNLLMRGFSADEIKRFEDYLNQRLSGKMDAITFEYYLHLPYRKNGVGLWRQRARKVADLTEEILSQEKRAAEVYQELAKNPETPLAEEIDSLRAWVLEVYGGLLDDQRRTRLNTIIEGRLRGTISMEDFQKTASLPVAKGGVGFAMRTAQKMSDRLEAVLRWGKTGNMQDAITAIAASGAA